MESPLAFTPSRSPTGVVISLLARRLSLLSIAGAGRHRPLVSELGDMHAAFCGVIAALEVGEVVSYGDVAEVAGFPGRARVVGRLLAAGGHDLPWWRVVTASGRLVPGLAAEQAAVLRAEGVRVDGDVVRCAPLGRFATP